jgi:hypothetical protein
MTGLDGFLIDAVCMIGLVCMIGASFLARARMVTWVTDLFRIQLS